MDTMEWQGEIEDAQGVGLLGTNETTIGELDRLLWTEAVGVPKGERGDTTVEGEIEHDTD